MGQRQAFLLLAVLLLSLCIDISLGAPKRNLLQKAAKKLSKVVKKIEKVAEKIERKALVSDINIF